MKAKTKLRRLLSLLLTLVMLASLMPVMGTTASAAGAESHPTAVNGLKEGGEMCLFWQGNGNSIVRYILKDYSASGSSAEEKWNQFKTDYHIGSSHKVNSADGKEKEVKGLAYYDLASGTLYLLGQIGGDCDFEATTDCSDVLTVIVDDNTTLRRGWCGIDHKGLGKMNIEFRNNATLNIPEPGKDMYLYPKAAALDITWTKETSRSDHDPDVKEYGELELRGTGKLNIVSPYVSESTYSEMRYGIQAKTVTIKDNVSLNIGLNRGTKFSSGILCQYLIIDTTGTVNIDVSNPRDDYVTAIRSIYNTDAENYGIYLTNAQSVTLKTHTESWVLGNKKLSGSGTTKIYETMCENLEGNGWTVTESADDAAPYTLKLTRAAMPTAAGLTVGDNPSVKNIGSAIPSVTVNGGETVSVKASVALPAWLSDMYKDGRVKLGDSGTLRIYKGNSLSSADLVGCTVKVDESALPAIGYKTNFVPEAGKTYTTYAIIPIVTVKDGKQLGSASVIATIKAAEETVLPVLDGSIVYTSGVKYGSDVTIGRTGMLNTISDKLNYQWQYGAGGKWRIISGVTGSMLPAEKITADMIGKQLRLKVTADGYEGVVYSEAKTVAKATWDQTPVPPALTCENGASSSIISAANIKADQQYLLTRNPMTDEQLAATDNWGNFTGSSSAANGYTFYIYTRMAETDTHSAGMIYRYSSVYTGKEVLLKNLTLEGYSAYGVNSTVYVKVGETVTIPVVKEPFNANTWYDFTVKTPTETSAFKVISPTSTVVSGSEIKGITIKGEAVGSEYLGAYYGSGTGTYYGQWNIKVYDPNNITSFDVIDPPVYGNVTLSVGDSYTPDKKTPSVSEIKTNPAGALNGYTLKWFVGTGSSYSGRAYGAENEYVKIDQTTGEITAKKATGDCDSVYKSVLLRAVKGNSTKDIASYSVAVTTAPVTALESISVLPGTKTLKVGESAALSAIKTPVNASGEFTWTSSNPGVARVDNTGKVTAVAKGTATITVACGGKTAACTITVVDADHTHSYGAWTKLNDEFHSRSCTGCDEALELKAHDFGAWALDKTDTSRHYRQCSQCGHKVYAAHTASDWIVDTAATATTEGVRHKECTVCGCVVETGKIPAIGKLPFEDVSTDAWFYGDVDYAYRNGLMNGTSTTVFSPDTPTTRGMIVTILYRLEKEPAVSANMPFSDVNSGSYYEKAIIWAEENDIVNGYGNGKFGPDDKITREQMAAILWRYAKYIGYDVSSGDKTDLQSYSDASSVSGYAVEAMKWANGEGIIKGITTTTLSPQGNATRAQVAAILHRFCNLIAG